MDAGAVEEVGDVVGAMPASVVVERHFSGDGEDAPGTPRAGTATASGDGVGSGSVGRAAAGGVSVGGSRGAGGGGSHSSGSGGAMRVEQPSALPRPSSHPREALFLAGVSMRPPASQDGALVPTDPVLASEGAHAHCATDPREVPEALLRTDRMPDVQQPVQREFHNPRRVAAMLAMKARAAAGTQLGSELDGGDMSHLQPLAVPQVGSSAAIEAELRRAEASAFDEAEAVRIATERVRAREARGNCERLVPGAGPSAATSKAGAGVGGGVMGAGRARLLALQAAAAATPPPPRGPDPTTIPKDVRLYSHLVPLETPEPVGVVRRVRKQVDPSWLSKRRVHAPDIVGDLPFVSRDAVEPKVRARGLLRAVPFNPTVAAALCCCDDC